ncbi:MAG TPA: response regulator transcription factor [Acidimicrobiales bacterium]|jgi:DNA-binding NarL/FixJ family response regulator|nr:response regulator transcription factor [Acidimicrobiales bacterium]
MSLEPGTVAPTCTHPLRVALLNSDELTLEGLRSMLAPHRDLVEVVGKVPVTENLLATLAEVRAEIVLVEVRLLAATGFEPSAWRAAGEAPFQVVIFTYEADEQSVSDALQRGASGYLLKSVSGDQLVNYLLQIRDGAVLLDPTLATRIAMGAAHTEGEHWPGHELGLSRRESEVLSLLVDGLSNRTIADQLVVGEETVKTHLRSIYRKLDVKDRAQAVASVLRAGIFT